MNIFVSGSDRGLGFGIVKILLERGHTVFAGQYMPHWQELANLAKNFENLIIVPCDVGSDSSVQNATEIIKSYTKKLDVIISNAAIIGIDDFWQGDIVDKKIMLDIYNINSLGAIRIMEYIFPLMQTSEVKKLCFISSEAGSITQCERDSMYWYSMSKAALNMYVKTMFNKHHKNGYKFRLYHPGWVRSYIRGSLTDYGAIEIDDAAALAVDYLIDTQINEDQLKLIGCYKEEYEF